MHFPVTGNKLATHDYPPQGESFKGAHATREQPISQLKSPGRGLAPEATAGAFAAKA
jgi:hypothetical protein